MSRGFLALGGDNLWKALPAGANIGRPTRRHPMETLISYLTAIISAASIIAAVTPTPKDDSIVAKIYRLVDLLAVNIGKAKDK